MLNLLRFVHLMSIVIWVGMLVFFTFFVAPSVFMALSRELAGDLVVVLFPKYWMIGYIAGMGALTSLVAISFMEKSFPAGRILLLTFMTVVTFYSGVVVAGKASAIRAEIKEEADHERKEALKTEFKKIHLKSSALNIMEIASGVFLVFLTARNMRL